MDKDEQIIFEKIQNLKTVRKPVPSRMDEVELSRLSVNWCDGNI